MVARNAAQQAARGALGHKGLALSASPGSGVLEPLGSLALLLTCHNDTCGSYVDELFVQVGGTHALLCC